MNTTETNKKLAKFLGRDKIDMLSRYIIDNSWLTDEMADTYKFNSDWNWLMMVVNKIEQTPQLGNETDNYIISILGNRCSVINLYGEIKTFDGQTKIEAVYNACSMFVDWYNNNGGQKENK